MEENRRMDKLTEKYKNKKRKQKNVNNQINSFAKMKSLSVFRVGLFFLIKSISSTFRSISLGWQIECEGCSVFDCVLPWNVYRLRNICAPQCVSGGDGSCSLYCRTARDIINFLSKVTYCSCLRTDLADFSSLKGKMIRTGLSTGSTRF